MHKRLAVLLLVLAMLLTACGHKEAAKDTEPYEKPPVAEETPVDGKDEEKKPVEHTGEDDVGSGEPDSADSKNPVQSDLASESDDPEEPNQTTKPNKPGKPDKPDEPNKPDHPSIPDKPEPPKEDGMLTYEEYNALSGEEQEAYFNSFESADDFFDWYNQAKEEYDDGRNDIIIGEGDTNVDLGDL